LGDETILTLCLAVVTQCRCVCDRQMDGQNYYTSIAQRYRTLCAI